MKRATSKLTRRFAAAVDVRLICGRRDFNNPGFSLRAIPATSSQLPIQRFVSAEDAVLVEGNALV